MGWQTLRNGTLLAIAAGQFDVMLTVDRNIRHQQNVGALPIAVIVLIAATTKLADLLPLVPAVEGALKNMSPCTLVEVATPEP